MIATIAIGYLVVSVFVTAGLCVLGGKAAAR